MTEQISPLNEETLAAFRQQREWVVSLLAEEVKWVFRDPNVKIAVLDDLIKSRAFGPERAGELQAMGVVFGDAIAQVTGMEWALVDDEVGRGPVLHLPGTSIRVTAYSMIQSRVIRGEDFGVRQLFTFVCERVKEQKPQTYAHVGFFGKLFKRHTIQ